jgi:hypothetical protein
VRANVLRAASRRALLAAAALLLAVGDASANVREENLAHLTGERRGGARGLLQAAAESLGRWHVNAPDAPEVTGATIKIARQVAMAGEEEEAAAKAAADAEEHAALTAAIVARITAPFAGTPPLHFALIGFGTTFLIIALFFLAEKLWLQARLRPRPRPQQLSRAAPRR